MVINERRNYQIFQDVARAAKEHRHILVLSERVQHLDLLYHMLRYIEPNCYVIQGDMKTKVRREMIAELQSLHDGFILLATGSLIGEGFDLPSLDTLFLTVPIRCQGRLNQYIGRIHRNYDGKNEVKVYDYVDFNFQMFQSMFAARLKEYYSNNYHLQEETESVIVDNQLFTGENYLSVLKEDIQHAKKSIYISTSYISLKLYKSLMKVFNEAQTHGTVICIETNSHQKDLEEISEFVRGLDITVNITDSAKQVIVIDQNIVWYGTVAILSIQKKEDYQIRLVNKKLAEEIYEK
jgi:superfamily II DNA or RNA helicase